MCPKVLFQIFLGVCRVILAQFKQMPTTLDPPIRPRVAEGQKLDRRKAVPVVPLDEKGLKCPIKIKEAFNCMVSDFFNGNLKSARLQPNIF